MSSAAVPRQPLGARGTNVRPQSDDANTKKMALSELAKSPEFKKEFLSSLLHAKETGTFAMAAPRVPKTVVTPNVLQPRTRKIQPRQGMAVTLKGSWGPVTHTSASRDNSASSTTTTTHYFARKANAIATHETLSTPNENNVFEEAESDDDTTTQPAPLTSSRASSVASSEGINMAEFIARRTSGFCPPTAYNSPASSLRHTAAQRNYHAPPVADKVSAAHVEPTCDDASAFDFARIVESVAEVDEEECDVAEHSVETAADYFTRSAADGAAPTAIRVRAPIPVGGIYGTANTDGHLASPYGRDAERDDERTDSGDEPEDDGRHSDPFEATWRFSVSDLTSPVKEEIGACGVREVGPEANVAGCPSVCAPPSAVAPVDVAPKVVSSDSPVRTAPACAPEDERPRTAEAESRAVEGSAAPAQTSPAGGSPFDRNVLNRIVESLVAEHCAPLLARMSEMEATIDAVTRERDALRHALEMVRANVEVTDEALVVALASPLAVFPTERVSAIGSIPRPQETAVVQATSPSAGESKDRETTDGASEPSPTTPSVAREMRAPDSAGSALRAFLNETCDSIDSDSLSRFGRRLGFGAESVDSPATVDDVQFQAEKVAHPTASHPGDGEGVPAAAMDSASTQRSYANEEAVALNNSAATYSALDASMPDATQFLLRENAALAAELAKETARRRMLASKLSAIRYIALSSSEIQVLSTLEHTGVDGDEE